MAPRWRWEVHILDVGTPALGWGVWGRAVAEVDDFGLAGSIRTLACSGLWVFHLETRPRRWVCDLQALQLVLNFLITSFWSLPLLHHRIDRREVDCICSRAPTVAPWAGLRRTLWPQGWSGRVMLLRDVCVSSGWNRCHDRWTRIGRVSPFYEPFSSLGQRRSVGDLRSCGGGGVIGYSILRSSLLWLRTCPRVLRGSRGLGKAIELCRFLLEISRATRSQRITTITSVGATLTPPLHHLRHRHGQHSLS